MPTFGKVNAKQLILEGNRAKRSFIRKEDSLSARKMTGFSLSREVTDRKARELAQKYKESGIIKTHKTAWKVWHDAKKRELEAGMKEKSKGEKMTTAQLRERMKKDQEKRMAGTRALEYARGKNLSPEDKKSIVERKGVRTSVFTRKDVSVTANQSRAKISAFDPDRVPSPSTQSVSAKKGEEKPVVALQI